MKEGWRIELSLFQRLLAGGAATTLLLISGAPPARADEPRLFERTRPEALGRLSFEAFSTLSFANFERPERACGFPPGVSLGSPNPFCPAADSNEVVFALGGALTLRVWGPIHISWGLSVGYTDPELDILEPQLIFRMPFSVVVTEMDWPVRPIVEGYASPFVLLPDGVKSFLFGGRGGMAVRWGNLDFGLTVGVAHSDEFRPWDFRLSVMHTP